MELPPKGHFSKTGGHREHADLRKLIVGPIATIPTAFDDRYEIGQETGGSEIASLAR